MFYPHLRSLNLFLNSDAIKLVSIVQSIENQITS
jgi:hypothetical protein